MKIRFNYPKISLQLQTEARRAKLAYLHDVMPALLRDLQAVTPVKTGKARDSWHLDYGDVTATIRNDVDYIKHLNAGSSQQAPAYFIENTVLNYATPQGPLVTYG